MAFSCFGTGATSEDSTMRGYDGKLYNLEEHDINRHHESSSHKGISKLEQLASAEQCIGETHWRRLLKQAGVLDFVGSSVATSVHCRCLLPGGMRRIRLKGFQRAIAMIANYCYPVQKEGEHRHGGSRTLVDTYIHFVRKHLSPLVCTSKISVGHQSSAISPNFEECDIAADLISEWRHIRESKTFVTSVDAIPEQHAEVEHARRCSAEQVEAVPMEGSHDEALERYGHVSPVVVVPQGDSTIHDATALSKKDDENPQVASRRAVTPVNFTSKAVLAAVKWRKRVQQKKTEKHDEKDGNTHPAESSSTMSKEKTQEFHAWLKEVYEYTSAFEEWIKGLSSTNDAYDYLDKACGISSGRVTLTKLQAAARTAKFTTSIDAVNILFYFLDIDGAGYISRSAFEQWRTVRQATIMSYMTLS